MRKIFLTITTLLAITLLAGCGSTEGNKIDKGKETESVIQISHSKGETVVPVNPEKVVVFDMGILDTMDSLGVEAEIAVPTASLTSYLKKYENAVNVGSIKEPDIEGIFEFEPEGIYNSLAYACAFFLCLS